MFEALMLVCFGASWPASIYKSIKLKDVRAKSQLFLWLVLAGYACGIINKVLTGIDWVIFFYIAVGILVLVDLILYYRYSSRQKGGASGTVTPSAPSCDSGQVRP